MQSDSVDKIVERYFHAVAKVAFTYKGKTFEPKPLKVSPLLLRDYTCPPGCGGCCFRFTLDYLPTGEDRPARCLQRFVEFDGKQILIYSDGQEDSKSDRCRYLLPDGRCGTYLRRPFTCDFELIRSLSFATDTRPNVLTQKLFGRGWSYRRTDGGKGAKCEMLGVSDKSIEEVVRKLNRLKAWTDHFGLETWIPEIIKPRTIRHLRTGRSVLFDPHQRAGFGL